MDFGIRSIPQTGGTSTTQQAIYLVHGSPCGINPFLLNKVGTTNITYIDMNNTLSSAISASQDAFLPLIEAFDQIQADPSEQNFYRLYKRYYEFGLEIWGHLSGFVQDGYTTTLTLYDEDGRTFFDSKLEGWFPVAGSGPFVPVVLTLVPTVISIPGPLGTYYLNPTGSDTADFYNISKTPSYWPYIVSIVNPQTGRNQSDILNSGFLLNQAQMFESLMASASLLVDTANTRFYNAIGSGFSARPVSPGRGNLGYYTCIILNISQQSRIVNQNFFVRLGLEKIIS